MISKSKRYRQTLTVAGEGGPYELKEAIDRVRKVATAKFDETIEMVFRLGIDPKKTEQLVRGAVVLPHGLGKKIRVLVFAKGNLADDATKAGADFVGFEDLIDKISKGWMDFDAVVAAPDTMKEVGKLGKTLGTKGLMPTPKRGTVTNEIAKAVKEAKAGRVEFRVDKTGNTHCVIGKKSFSVEQLFENGKALVDAIVRARPSTIKGALVRRCFLAPTMGPSVSVDVRGFEG